MRRLRLACLPLLLPLAACTGADAGDESGSTSATGLTTPTNAVSAGDTTDAPVTTGAVDTTTTDATTGFASLSDPVGTTYASFGDSTEGDVCMQQIDIVFSMDVSTSMLALLQTLENEILSVDEKLKSLSVVPDVHYGLVVFVDDTRIINVGAPYADVQTLKSDFNYWWNFTQSNQQTNGDGYNVDWPENSLDALFLAAGGFQWRPIEDTLRLVIHCTDDTFGDKGALLSGIPVQRSYDEVVAALQAKQVRVFVFADADATGGPSEDQDVSPGFFTPYQGKPPIPEATAGGAYNINLVLEGQLSLGAAINDSVEGTLCEPYVPL